MEKNKEFEEFLYRTMSPEEFSAPDIELVKEARKKVLARRKASQEESVKLLDKLIGYFNLQLRFYHLGISVLLVFAGFFYFNDRDYSRTDGSGLMEYHADLSINNTTVSVTSSTMLTSIPTLVIRN
jgi:hypothetical protein